MEDTPGVQHTAPAQTTHTAFAGSRVTAFAPDPKGIITGDTQGLIRIWSPKRDRVLSEWFAHDGPIRKLFIQGDSIGSVGADGSVAIWTRTAVLKTRLRLPKYGLNDAHPLPDGSLLVAGERGIVARISNTPLWRMPSIHGRAAFGVAIGPKLKRAASVGSDGVLRIWAIDSGRELNHWVVDSKLATRVLWNDTGIFTAGGDGVVTLWSDPTGWQSGACG